MSLLNDMLRDLARQQPADLSQDDGQILLQQASEPQRTWVFWFSSVLIFILVFLLVLAIKHFVVRVFEKNNTLEPVPSTATSLKIDTSPKIVTAQTNNQPAVVATSSSETPLVVMDNNPTNNTIEAPQKNIGDYSTAQLQIDDLLSQADHALASDRLTSPIEDNAYSYYKKILSLDPNHPQAQQGLEIIAAHYLAKAKGQLQLGNRSQANDFIQRAIFVDPDFTQAQITANHLDVDATENIAIKVIPVVEPMADVSKNKSTTSIEQKPVQTESIKPFAVAEAQSLSVTPNAASKDEQLAQRAQQFLSQGKMDEALVLLKNFVVNEIKPAQSAALLADIYLQQGNLEAAEALLNQATYLSAIDKAKINARLLSLKGNDSEAISVLERQLSAADGNENYRALLASLYHKTGNYQLSAVNYQRLLNNFGDKPAYWLGLALAFDGLSQYKSALQAYKRLREFPQLQEQVKTYTDQRIAALRSE